MNLSDSNSTSPPSSKKARAGSLCTDVSSRNTFYKFVHQQNFNFRATLISYISKNPTSSKLYQKLIKTCKHFFIINPIVVFAKLNCDFINNECLIQLNGKNTDLKRFLSKIWVTYSMRVGRDFDQNLASSIIPKIYQSDIKHLQVFKNSITYNDLIFLASNLQKLVLIRVNVINNDGSVVALEKLIEALPQLDDIFYILPETSTSIISSKTVQELINLPHFSNFDRFSMDDIPDSFDIEDFFEYMEKNKKTKFYLYFREDISQEYQDRLKNIFNKIIKTKNHDYRIPVIKFPGLTDSQYFEIHSLGEIQSHTSK